MKKRNKILVIVFLFLLIFTQNTVFAASTDEVYFYAYYNTGLGQDDVSLDIMGDFIEYQYIDDRISNGGNRQQYILPPSDMEWRDQETRYTIRLKKNIYRFGIYDSSLNLLEVLSNSFFDLTEEGSPYDYTKNRSFKQIADTYGIKNFYIKPYEIKRPAISGTDVILNDIDKPYSLSQIKQIIELSAYDDYYGDLTHLITISDDNFSANKHKPGTFTISFMVTNPAGLSTETILNVINKDIKAPVITGPKISEISYTKLVTNEDIISLYTVEDNYDSNVDIEVESTNYVKGQTGSFFYTLMAKDSSGNISRVTHTLNVFDDVNPVIIDSHIDVIVLNWRQAYTNNDLLLGLSASDEIDGNITDRIIIKSSDFKSGIVGEYKVVYEISDSAGNKFSHERAYHIKTTDVPIFYVSKNILLIEDVNEMSIDQIIFEMAKYENLDVASYIVLTDDYSQNKQTPGTYNISASLSLKTGETIEISKFVKVFTLHTDNNTEDVLNQQWYENIKTPIIIVVSFICLSIVASIIIIKVSKRKNK